MSFKNNEQTILNELSTVLSQISDSDVQKAIDVINSSDKIFLKALGRAADSGKAFIMRLGHMGRDVYVLGETNTRNFSKGDLLIVCSGSGETKEFILYAQKAKDFGGELLVFTGNGNSTLAKMADAVILIKAPSKNQGSSDFHSVQPMASLFEQGILIAGDAIILTMMDESHEDNQEMFSRHSNLE